MPLRRQLVSISLALSLVASSVACGTNAGVAAAASSSSVATAVGAGGGGGQGGGGVGGAVEPVFRISSPEKGSSIFDSINVAVEVKAIPLTSVKFFRKGNAVPICSDDAANYSCLVDLSLEATGSMHTIEVRGFDGDNQVASDSIALTRQSPEAPICKDGDGFDEDLASCLKDLAGKGTAAGNAGDSYDNLDMDHTGLAEPGNWPGMKYLHTGYGTGNIGNAAEHQDKSALIGNAFLCSIFGDDCWGQARVLMSYGRAGEMAKLYRGNKLFWFPEHLDHDEIDKAHYMVPFTNCSQGSSGSEIDEVMKFLFALGALKPDTKTAVMASGTLMPTLQMIFRRTRVASDTEYLSGVAHANAFDDKENAHAMVRRAQLLTKNVIPPVAEMSVVEEDWNEEAGERAFTTPLSIARKWMGATDKPRRIVVQVKASDGGSAGPLSYHWRVLRGDPKNVRVVEKSPDASKVAVEIDHHIEQTVMVDGAPHKTKLVVVGVFIHNGAFLSAPSFVTSYAEK
jgi:hypothetical protein